MWDVSETGRLHLAGDIFINCPVAVAVNGEPLVSMVPKEADGRLAVDFDVRDFVGHRGVMVRNGVIARVDAHIEVIREPNRQAAVDTETGIILCEVLKDPGPGVERRIVFQTFIPGGIVLLCAPNGFFIRKKVVYAENGSVWEKLSPAVDLALTASGAPLLLSDWKDMD